MRAWLAVLALMQGGGAGLSVEDLGAYRAALEDDDRSQAPPASFSDLWKRPDEFLGRRVRFAGRLVRDFHAPASGELPARVEYWMEEERGNLVCAVVPDSSPPAPPGSTVTIEGTSLGLIRYQGGDGFRLAPLIVGPGPPRPLAMGRDPRGVAAWDANAWLVGSLGAAIVVAFLARGFARRPAAIREKPGPGVEFHS